MTALLPRPVGRQKEVLALPAAGHTVVLGTAGSGKTTLALHRAAYLANAATDHGGRTLLVTFNKCLVAYLQALGGRIGNVEVRNYHHFARGYLASRGKMERNSIATPDLVIGFGQRAIDGVKKAGWIAAAFDRPSQFLVEEFGWISQNGLRSSDDYIDAEEDGRQGARVPRAERRAVFAAYDHYRALRNAAGKSYDWDDLAQTVVSEFASDGDARYYKHVIVDEGQDFSPVMLQSLAAAVPPDGSLTFFGDVAQQIYGHKISWRSAGLNVQDRDVWRFEQNYRNTKQIAQLALAIAKSSHYRGIVDLIEPKSPTADGPLPALVGFRTEGEELQFVAAQAEKLAETGTVAVLFRDRELEQVLPRLVSVTPTRLHRDLSSWPRGPELFYGTYHAAKGLEFDSVLVPYASSHRLPHPPDITAFGLDDAAARNTKLLYVAVTRAKSNLVFTHSGAPTSLLPVAAGLLQRSQR
jgi:superfamily I DNA/RNA helicase